ncbi:MAG TPA: hypothetical protein VKP30_25940, partial [Polyangiaceae bacterium]|nr:hypothetical protein [Polyangiaceae bacterium]
LSGATKLIGPTTVTAGAFTVENAFSVEAVTPGVATRTTTFTGPVVFTGSVNLPSNLGVSGTTIVGSVSVSAPTITASQLLRATSGFTVDGAVDVNSASADFYVPTNFYDSTYVAAQFRADAVVTPSLTASSINANYVKIPGVMETNASTVSPRTVDFEADVNFWGSVLLPDATVGSAQIMPNAVGSSNIASNSLRSRHVNKATSFAATSASATPATTQIATYGLCSLTTVIASSGTTAPNCSLVQNSDTTWTLSATYATCRASCILPS